MSELIREAFKDLYPDKELKYSVSLKYSRKFKPYNANVKRYENNLTFHLSKDWRKISKEIQIGLIQELLTKILKSDRSKASGELKTDKIKDFVVQKIPKEFSRNQKFLSDKKKTINMELYNIFMKNVHLAVPKTKTDEILEESFDRVNESYFSGMLDKPNLQWGNDSTSKLGSYEYGSDTITISSIFKNSQQELLDYIVYHEMLHKKFKFQNKNWRNLHHSPEFKRMEKKFENRDLIEKEISKFARKHKFSLRKAILSF